MYRMKIQYPINHALCSLIVLMCR